MRAVLGGVLTPREIGVSGSNLEDCKASLSNCDVSILNRPLAYDVTLSKSALTEVRPKGGRSLHDSCTLCVKTWA